jgi:glycosyltransferase involved in cell wall biosynthesis
VIGTSVDPFAAHAGQVLARRHKVPFILEIGDIWPRTLAEMGALKRWHPIYWVLRLLELRLYQKAVRILSKLPLAKVHVASSHGNPAKVVYLPNGVDVGPFVVGEYPEAPVSLIGFVVLYAGGMTPIYGLENLIDAAGIVAEKHPEFPISFRLFGSGRSRSELQDRANRLGLSNLEFFDPVPRTEVPSVLAEADALVAIARDIGVVREFGMSHNKVFEYLEASRPIIFSVASANNPVAEAEAGISVEPENASAIADAVIELYKMTRQERIQMGRRGHAFVRRGYTMEEISERFVRIIEEVLGGLPPGTTVSSDDLTG